MANTQRKDQDNDGRGNPENLDPKFADIAQALSGIDLPQDRQGLVECAEENDADEEIIEMIKDLPDRQYETMADVIGAAK